MGESLPIAAYAPAATHSTDHFSPPTHDSPTNRSSLPAIHKPLEHNPRCGCQRFPKRRPPQLQQSRNHSQRLAEVPLSTTPHSTRRWSDCYAVELPLNNKRGGQHRQPQWQSLQVQTIRNITKMWVEADMCATPHSATGQTVTQLRAH